ncbi:MAG: hypothetical protein M3340_10065 [Actinomycetota bacterium]|nr:hypothetical protein [Actinomycetota bacterium]
MSTLRVLVFALIASSAVHYTDNAIMVDEYPGAEPGGAPGVALFWIGFTAAGLIGLRLYERGRRPLAEILLLVFAYGGVTSIGHYLSDGMSELAWWRHVSVWTDIVLGLAVTAYAVRSLLTRRRGAVATAAR